MEGELGKGERGHFLSHFPFHFFPFHPSDFLYSFPFLPYTLYISPPLFPTSHINASKTVTYIVIINHFQYYTIRRSWARQTIQELFYVPGKNTSSIYWQQRGGAHPTDKSSRGYGGITAPSPDTPLVCIVSYAAHAFRFLGGATEWWFSHLPGFYQNSG